MRFKILKATVVVLMLTIGGLVMAAMANVGINVSASYPLGLYQHEPIHNPPHKNKFVLVCPDPRNPVIREAKRLKILAIGSCPGGYAPFLKKLRGVPGDRVTVTDQGVLINGKLLENSKIKFKIFEMLIRPGYTHTLRPGEYWVMSDYSKNSLDCRYIGPISRSSIIDYTRPIFTIK